MYPLPGDLPLERAKDLSPALQRGLERQTTFEGKTPTTVGCMRNPVSSNAFHQKWREDQTKGCDAKTSPCDVTVQNDKVKEGWIKAGHGVVWLFA